MKLKWLILIQKHEFMICDYPTIIDFFVFEEIFCSVELISYNIDKYENIKKWINSIKGNVLYLNASYSMSHRLWSIVWFHSLWSIDYTV